MSDKITLDEEAFRRLVREHTEMRFALKAADEALAFLARDYGIERVNDCAAVGSRPDKCTTEFPCDACTLHNARSTIARALGEPVSSADKLNAPNGGEP